MSEQVTVRLHRIDEDGLPDMDRLTGRVAFLFDGCVVSGWPLGAAGDVWEANDDVGHGRPFGGVTHWLEFPIPVWELAKEGRGE